MSQLEFWTKTTSKNEVLEWTFNGAPTREYTHCYHDYPARMIPQIASKLLGLFADKATLLFDPYCGTGTSLVEALVKGIHAVGTDLNPLARLIAKAKTSTPNLREIDKQLKEFQRFLINFKSSPQPKSPKVKDIKRLDFWFKAGVIEKLSRVHSFIGNIDSESVRLFFQVAFSETVREASNTRNGEFKLYRYDSESLEKFNPDVFRIMFSKLERNQAGLQFFTAIMKKFKRSPKAVIYDFNTVKDVPAKKIAPYGVDIVITSPPYGDSHTTVAYGQYSRLSAAWLGLNEPEKIDRSLMGGTRHCKQIPEFPSRVLNKALGAVHMVDPKRSLEVAAFYLDLFHSINNVARTIKQGGYACYVVGNRRVKGISLPTDIAIRNFFEECGFEYIHTFLRSIPNKRMPLRNSPTNIPGVVDTTMAREYIVVMRRKKNGILSAI
jgi:DNA modification methylase